MKLKKPKFWDNKQPNLFAKILYPISHLIQILKYFKRKPTKNNFQIKTICFEISILVVLAKHLYV